MEQIPLIEFDQDKTSITDPSKLHKDTGEINPPMHCILPMSGTLINKLENDGRLKKIYELYTPLVPIGVYRIEFEDKLLTVAHPGTSAPHVVAIFEELTALGCRKFIACGSAGVLRPELKRGTVIIPSSALRDEGTSYHYCSPSRVIDMDKEVVKKLESVLQRHNVDYIVGKTWTTDGFYRETRGKVAKRASEGCITVEMECSALIAAAKFRDVTFGQYLVAADDVSGEEWDLRHIDGKMQFQEKVFWLSVEACLEL